MERFIRNPSLQVLEFQPMPSSYLRLAAHRVAQHYYLQSMVVDGGSAEGTRIVARKTGETRFPSLRLVDLPIAPTVGEQEEKKAVLVQVVPAKVAIKQRPTKGGRNNGLGPGGNGGKLNPAKSVEERKEEYNKVRLSGRKCFSMGVWLRDRPCGCKEILCSCGSDDCELQITYAFVCSWNSVVDGSSFCLNMFFLYFCRLVHASSAMSWQEKLGRMSLSQRMALKSRASFLMLLDGKNL